MPKFKQPRFRPDLAEEDFIFLFQILNTLSARRKAKIVATEIGYSTRIKVLDANDRERACKLFSRFNKILEDRGYQI